MIFVGKQPFVSIQSQDFNIGEILSEISSQSKNIGAVVSFSGLCRDEGGQLSSLELEHYPAMAEAEISRIAQKAYQHWPLDHLITIHRFGKIKPGGNIVFVAATSSHRQAAFQAASYMMDFLKTQAPFWKKEHLVDGSSGDWVEAASKDDEAAARWKELD